ncbi:hypothetical protein DXG01_000161 [Tephrocybe rancida]|nr:hypothetical protein DXG01_000161 [Tephrocybe rancida]
MASSYSAYSYSDIAELQYPSSPSASSHSSTDSTTYLAYNPCPAYTTEPYALEPPPYSTIPDAHSEKLPRPRGSTRLGIAHPYARLYAKKEEVKRRKIWNHALEKSLFSPYEISTIGAPQRRTIYIASLEAHIDKLHAQLLELGFWPVPMEELKPYHGLNSKTAKSIVSGLQHDASVTRLKMLELERANKGLSATLHIEPPQGPESRSELSPYQLSAYSAATSRPSAYSVNTSEPSKHYAQFSM